MIVHDFAESLRFSEDPEHDPFWDAVYRKAFPNLVNHMHGNGDFQSQRLGIDRVALLGNGETIKIEQKMRSDVYPDILLEYISVDRTNAPGWMEKDLDVDFLAYAFLPVRVCYLFIWSLLKRAWVENKGDWLNRYVPKGAKNPGYTTWNVPVPLRVLLDEIPGVMLIDASGEVPVQSGGGYLGVGEDGRWRGYHNNRLANQLDYARKFRYCPVCQIRPSRKGVTCGSEFCVSCWVSGKEPNP